MRFFPLKKGLLKIAASYLSWQNHAVLSQFRFSILDYIEYQLFHFAREQFILIFLSIKTSKCFVLIRSNCSNAFCLSS